MRKSRSYAVQGEREGSEPVATIQRTLDLGVTLFDIADVHKPRRPRRTPAHVLNSMSLRATTLAAGATIILTAILVAGCGDGSGRSADQSPVGPEPTAPAPSTQEPTRNPADDRAREAGSNQENPMLIRITIGNQTFNATLHDSAAANDLVAQLPVTVEMTDHAGVEKTGRLPAPLSLQRQPQGADPNVGDLGYYAPGNDLVLYYGDQSYFPGIVILGRLDGNAAERIARMNGAVTATVEAR